MYYNKLVYSQGISCVIKCLSSVASEWTLQPLRVAGSVLTNYVPVKTFCHPGLLK